MNRARLLEAAVAAASELGSSRVSVTEIVARAELSRGTFYALFADRDSCMAAVLEDLLEDIEVTARAERSRAATAEDRTARGLAGALRAADADVRRARCCLAPAARHEPNLLAAQARATGKLAEAIARARSDLSATNGSPAAAKPERSSAEEVLARVREHLGETRERPLIGLFGELMSIVVGPLAPAAALKPPPASVRRAGPPGVSPRKPGTRRDWVQGRSREESGASAESGGRVRLTSRTLEVLENLREHPGESNRGLARRAGGLDGGQISKLLRKLEGRGLIVNHGEIEYSWSANSWFLTDRGRELIDR